MIISNLKIGTSYFFTPLEEFAKENIRYPAYCIMTQLLLRDATKNAAMFGKSLKVFVNYAEAEVAKHYNFVKSVDVEAMESYRKA